MVSLRSRAHHVYWHKAVYLARCLRSRAHHANWLRLPTWRVGVLNSGCRAPHVPAARGGPPRARISLA